jgi:small subunit ribosomal protein S1
LREIQYNDFVIEACLGGYTKRYMAYDLKAVRRGDILTGTIVSITPNEILVDIGSKSEGIVAGRELEKLDPEDLAALCEGSEIPVYVVKPEDEEGNTILSLARAQAEKDWLAAQKLYEEDGVYKGVVAGHNKGGLIVHYGQIRGFVPGSQLASDHRARGVDKDDQWSHMLEQELHLKIIEIDRRRNRLIRGRGRARRARHQPGGFWCVCRPGRS